MKEAGAQSLHSKGAPSTYYPGNHQSLNTQHQVKTSFSLILFTLFLVKDIKSVFRRRTNPDRAYQIETDQKPRDLLERFSRALRLKHREEKYFLNTFDQFRANILFLNTFYRNKRLFSSMLLSLQSTN